MAVSGDLDHLSMFLQHILVIKHGNWIKILLTPLTRDLQFIVVAPILTVQALCISRQTDTAVLNLVISPKLRVAIFHLNFVSVKQNGGFDGGRVSQREHALACLKPRFEDMWWSKDFHLYPNFFEMWCRSSS